MACTLLKYAWAVGGGDFCLPDGVGIEFDVSSRDKAWHVLEIHYDNPNAMSTIRDTSGVHITLVKKKLIPAGFMWVGSSLKALSVPPGKKVHHVEVTCRYPQIPTAGVNAFAFINHAHLLGRKLYTSLTRKGKYIHDLGCDTAYDFDLQQILPLEKEVKLYKTDTLKANCVYDSTERTATTQGGDETENEMCINFIACKVAASPTPPTYPARCVRDPTPRHPARCVVPRTPEVFGPHRVRSLALLQHSLTYPSAPLARRAMPSSLAPLGRLPGGEDESSQVLITKTQGHPGRHRGHSHLL